MSKPENAKAYVVGVGPGSPSYLTRKAQEVLEGSDIIAGFQHSLNTVEKLLTGKEVYVIKYKQQAEILKKIGDASNGKICSFTCTGDPDFSDSEYIRRLTQIYGSIEIIPGVSSIQVAAARFGFPIDKSRIISFHVTGDIEAKKAALLKSVQSHQPVIILPRPWDFMPDKISQFLIENGVEDSTACGVCEKLTLPEEAIFRGVLRDTLKREFSDLSVVLIGEGELSVR